MATIKSIEEKAKSFKEALSRAKGFYKRFPEYKEILEKIFPELKESEDEKTKRVLHSIANKMSQHLRDIFSEEEFQCYDAWSNAWLEKQGGQKLYVNDNAKEMFIKALERVEEQNNKGYKLTDCDKNSWWEDFKAYTSCSIVQKTAWSEEDEYCIHQLIVFCENCMVQDDGAKRCAQWLKFLKGRVQPKQEWSEEDELIINKILCICYDFERSFETSPASTKIIKEDVDKIDNWLKSLKERYTWKPSDEQMEALDDFIYAKYPNVEKHEAAVKSLYQDLKKLMEG